MNDSEITVISSDVAILRELATRVAELAASPLNRERIRLWYQHDECQGERPLLLTETDGGLDMVIPDYRPRCQEPWAQAQEWALLQPIVHHEIIGDDWPIEPCVNVPWQITLGDFGVIPHSTQPETDGTRGAYHIDAVLGDLEADFGRLHPRAFSVDRPATLAQVALLSQVYDGILTVRLRGNPWWTLGVTNTAVTLIGMEKLMLAMYDQPAALHRLLAFLCDDHLLLVDWLEREGLLTLNNENDYIGSGSRGYTRALPHRRDKLSAEFSTPWATPQPVRTPRQVEDSGVPNSFGAFSGQFLMPRAAPRCIRT